MKAILRSINNFSCKLKQSNNLKYNISPKIRSNKFKNISGNGNIVIEDALSKSVKDYKIYGNTYQNSTSGKNLLDYITGFNFTHNGTVNTLSEDGTITVTGKPTANYTQIVTRKDITDILEDGETYTLSMTNKQIYVWCEVIGVVNEKNTTYYSSRKTNNGETFTIDKSQYDRYDMYIITATTKNWGDSDRTISSKFQLEKGDSKTEFEPYTGGQPSPNPDYPQEIISCGDRTKSLFDLSKVSEYTTASGIQISVVQENVKVKGTNSSSSAVGVYLNSTDNYYSLKAGKTYVAKYITGQSASASTYRLDIRPTSSTGTVLAYETGENGLSYTPTEDINIRFYVRIPANGTVDLSGEIMFEESDTLHDYEPYGYKIPVNVRSENLCDGINKKYWLSTTVLSVGMADGNSGLAIELKENTNYTISTQIIQERYRVALINTLPTSGTGIPCYNGVKKDGTKDNITISSSQYKYLILNATDLTKCQIVEGSTAPNKYIPYYNETTNIYLDEPLRGIGEYSDYIDFINGKVVRNIKEIILNGSNDEDWKKLNLTFYLQYNFSKTFNSLCTHFIKQPDKEWTSSNEIYRGKFSMFNIDNQLKFMPTDENVNTLELWKTWLSSNNVIVDYALSTPTKEDIELPNINLIEGKNIITIGTEVFDVFEVEYYSKEIIDISDYKYNLRKVED